MHVLYNSVHSRRIPFAPHRRVDCLGKRTCRHGSKRAYTRCARHYAIRHRPLRRIQTYRIVARACQNRYLLDKVDVLLSRACYRRIDKRNSFQFQSSQIHRRTHSAHRRPYTQTYEQAQYGRANKKVIFQTARKSYSGAHNRYGGISARNRRVF